MTERQADLADWVVPAILVGVGVGLLIMFGVVSALIADDRAEDPTLVQEFDVYTACLVDHGANVPRVEARLDGGFSVTVPGSLVDGNVDTGVWRDAHDQCSEVAPDLLGRLFGGLPGGLLGGLSGGLMGGFDEDLLDGIDSFDGHGVLPGFEAHAFGPEPGFRPNPVGPPDQGMRTIPPGAVRELCEELERGTISMNDPRLDRLMEHCTTLER